MSSKALPEALAERPATTAPPIRLKIVRRTETVDLADDGYTDPPLTVTLWVNPPAQQLDTWLNGTKAADGEVATPGLTTAGFLAQVIQDWTLELEDGQKAPITADVLDALPGEVLNILSDEFWLRSAAPLKARRERLFSPPARATPLDLNAATSTS